MTSNHPNDSISLDESIFWNQNDSKGCGALEHQQGGGKPFDTIRRDEKSFEVNYLRSYDLSINRNVDTYSFIMDPMDHFHSLAAEDDLIDCFLHLPMSENIPFVLSYETIAQAQPAAATARTEAQ
jgi:hypothetical protein